MNEIADMLGLENTFSDISGWAEVSEEQVIERNPDIIVTTTMYFGEGPTPKEEILARTGWDDLTAIQDDMVYEADSNMITRPGPRLADAAEELYTFVYGE
jgi:iron complex transport system substrate-binding protein